VRLLLTVRSSRPTPAAHRREAHEDHDAAGHKLKPPSHAADPLDPRDEAVGKKGGEHEGHAEPERIDREQSHAFGDACLGRCYRQDRSEDRANARRPAEPERQSERIGGNRSPAFSQPMEAELAPA
jgi:hypothetical protein